MTWIDARKKLPPSTEHPVRYLAILESGALSQHCKDWTGIGKPEIVAFCSQWKPYPWAARGTLEVAYWMETPSFDKKWDKTSEGVPGRWIEG